MSHELDRLFRPRRVAVVGAGPNDPARMGTRTLHDLVESGWSGDIYPVSSRFDELYGLRTYRSLLQLPAAPDVVLARTPSAGIEALVDDAVAVGAGFLVILAAGFAESGPEGKLAQQRVLERARRGNLRIVGPQSIGLVHCTEQLPMSLSQIMERFAMRPGPVALLSQSGAMAIQLAVRGQTEVGLDFSCVATFGNSADVTAVEAMDWLATDSHTRIVGAYLEGIADGDRLARAIKRCQAAGQRVVVLRAGLSQRGAKAVASHTASMSGDADTFRAMCRQLGVVLCESSEAFLWALKATAATPLESMPRVAFASISGGACALWADHSERLGLKLPALEASQMQMLQRDLPAFLSAANPMDVGPAVFDDRAFEATLKGLSAQPSFNLLVLYLFTSSPTLMGGLGKIRLLETLADSTGKPLWVIWEAATPDEWAALASSKSIVAFRDLGQAARALADFSQALSGTRYEAWASCRAAMNGIAAKVATEPAVKALLRDSGLDVPRGAVCSDAEAAAAFAKTMGGPVVLKIVSSQISHKSDVGGVLECAADLGEIGGGFESLLATVRSHRPDAELEGVLVEERIRDGGIELFVTVRRDPVFDLVTVVGRGGIQIEVDRDYVVHVGRLRAADLPVLLGGLRCAPLLGSYRNRPAPALDALAAAIERLQEALTDTDLQEIEINPLLLTPNNAWVLDALART